MGLDGRNVWDQAKPMKPDRTTLQLIENSLQYASEEMGLALRNSAYSPNIAERMDHSAAVFDADGRLLAQAEHIPVHLGSLPWGLRNILARCSREGIEFLPGSMVVSNNPYLTGTHLNDVTLVAPVYSKGTLVAFAANKAHHADVGGKVPGSISMLSRTLQEEGHVLDPVFLVKDDEFVNRTVEEFCRGSRNPSERRGDLKAQRAANVAGARRIEDVVSAYGTDFFALAAEESLRHSETLMRKRLSRIEPGSYSASDVLEGKDGEDLVVAARVTVSKDGVQVDYSGTTLQVDYPLNAVFGVTISGVYFVVRTLTGDDIPANHGAFAPIRVTAPSGTLVNPTYPHPVGGGNVETSQRNADVIYRALSKSPSSLVPAAAGGSMNNVMIGGRRRGKKWAFYETIGVGLGGRAGSDGVDGIQANMTNTMNTPIEEVERRLPLMITRYEFREGSSGGGEWRGGVGLVRRYRVLSDLTTLTVVADRELHRPWGLASGLPGSATEVRVRRGRREFRVSCKSTHRLGEGDEFEIRTAGGGGYGKAGRRAVSLVARDVEDGLVAVGQSSPASKRH